MTLSNFSCVGWPRSWGVLLLIVAVVSLTYGCESSKAGQTGWSHRPDDSGAEAGREGTVLWTRPVSDAVESTPAVDRHGNIYCVGGSTVYSFTKDGSRRWARPIGRLVGEFNSPALSPDERVLYGGGSNFVYALDAKTGRTLWKTDGFTKGFHSVPAVSRDGSRVYFGLGAERDEGDSFYCIDTSDGSVVWEYVMQHPARGIRGYLGGAIVGEDGTIYVASQHGWLISLTDQGGACLENWAYDAGAEMRMPPALGSDGFLYVGTSSAGGYLHKVDAQTGKSAGGAWPVRTTSDEVFACLAIAGDGTVYVNSEDARLWAFRPDGSVKWNNLVFESWGSDPLIRSDGRVILGAEIQGSARLVCVRDDGDEAVIEWQSEPFAKSLHLNETNVTILPNGTFVISSGQYGFHHGNTVELFAIKGNGLGLCTAAQWPKLMGNIQNNGLRR